ncbi:C1 family peptidase [Methanobrevibacter sp.]|uniref:C1 family peptidase n=1 Tax=Methanobrevibacter sp. TaxID=66852 RepID=UPI002E774426|nr:C1 family peptidase [Methanobrevibacter sp.]MEE0939732.1 C1 family peptidase [Methanobrevibacter sp.]
MKFKYIFIASLILAILMVSAVSANDTVSQDIISDNDDNSLEITQDRNTETETTKTFTDLYVDISNATGVLDIQCNYKYNNKTDQNMGISLVMDNFVINGNGHTLDANNQSRIFQIRANNITINNLTLINANMPVASVLFIAKNCSLTTNNVIFKNNTAETQGTVLVNGKYVSNNDSFIDSTSTKMGTVTLLQGGKGVFNNAIMMSSKQLTWGLLYADFDSYIYVCNSTFANTTSKYTTAIRGNKATVIENSKFINLHAISAGAIGAKCASTSSIDELTINNCTFVNVTSEKNAGAILADVFNKTVTTPVTITNSRFVDCYSEFGGAVMQYGGTLTVDNCTFKDTYALFDGGALYTSYAAVNIVNSTFDENKAEYNGTDRPTYGGTIFCDMGRFNLTASTVKNSDASTAAIYLYDCSYSIADNAFENNCPLNGSYMDIYTVFDTASGILENNTYSGNDTLSLNNKIYESIINATGMKLTLINNTINVTSLPSKFDLRDWGWVTPVKDQGSMGACWAFGTFGAIESAVLRYLGLEIDGSENNMQDTSLQYYRYGTKGMVEGGSILSGALYALSWFGVIYSEDDSYDEFGKISPIIAINNSIHLQDVVFIPPRKNVTDNNLLKEAIIKYGAVGITYFAEQFTPEYNPATGAQYCNETKGINHGVTLIGWDDNYSASNFLITPPGDGAWIFKNSWGENSGNDGYYYASYYDVNFATHIESVAFVLENAVEYNMNYQMDIGGVVTFKQADEYANAFVAVADDLIAGVGTYFNASGVDYIVEVYVNEVLKLNQSGTSPFYGFHTIKLDSYIPVKKGDVFYVNIKSTAVPILIESRQHYPEGLSAYLMNGTWVNASDNNTVCAIKVYTVADDSQIIDNEDISVDYAKGKYFSVKVVTTDGHAVAGTSVGFTINGKTINATTDSGGIAELEIVEVPGTYVITTVYNNQTYENNVTVKLDSKNCKAVAENIAVDYASGSHFTVKVVSSDGKVAVAGESVIFIFNGDAITAKTDNKGIAKIKITQTPGTYTIKTVFNGKTYTNKVTVKQVLKTSKVTVKKTAKKFTLKAKLKINGKLVKDKLITFKFNGKTYKVKTNSKGIAQKTLNKNVIKKLKKGKKYTVKVTYLKDTIKTTVKVK